MILTGDAIYNAWLDNQIIITPFDRRELNPNSFNFRLAPVLKQRFTDHKGKAKYETIVLGDEGFVLNPGYLYLGATLELIGSREYVVTLLGRSSIGRLGLFLNVTADLGHAGSVNHWTLELTVVQPLRIYPKMRIGQVAFWRQMGRRMAYKGQYMYDTGPEENRDIQLAMCDHPS